MPPADNDGTSNQTITRTTRSKDPGHDSSLDTRARVLVLLRGHGWNATSYQILQRGFEYFFDGDDSCVGYVDTGRAWVAAGAPLCDQSRFADVVHAFVAAARSHGRRACFFGTEERFAMTVGLRSLLIGEQAVWDPALWDDTVAGTRSLREQLRRARSKGVRVRPATIDELSNPSSSTALAVSHLVRRWLSTHEMAPMGFLVDLDPLDTRDDHRLYLAEVDAAAPVTSRDNSVNPAADAPSSGANVPRPKLVGLLAASPIFARRGWLLQAVVRAPDAPNGTAELLVDQAMRAAAAGDDAFVTLGLAPLAGPVTQPLRWVRSAGTVFFDFQGLWSFKAKLRPQRWDPVFLSFPLSQSVTLSLADVLTAFARGHLLRFGLQTLLRGPAIVVTLLTLALGPWTAVLAATDSKRWFPHPAIKWAWVVFDVLLFIGLASLSRGRRWRDGLARVLWLAVGVDALVTAGEAVLWNLSRMAGRFDVVVLAVAVAAPTLAFGVLWRARLRRL